MAFERVETVGGGTITPDIVVAQIRAMLDQSAQFEFDKAVKAITGWVNLRLLEVNLFAAQTGVKCDKVRLGLNAYNRRDGLGIQSVAISCMAGDRILRCENEYQDPTIGVVASGLVGENSKKAVIGIPVADGNTEVVMAQTHGLLLDAAGESDLLEGDVAEAPVGEAVHVEGPNFARMILEVAEGVDVEPEAIREAVRNAGVYICQYFKTWEELAREAA